MMVISEYGVAKDASGSVIGVLVSGVLVESESTQLIIDRQDDGVDLILSFQDEDKLEIEAVALINIPPDLDRHIQEKGLLDIGDTSCERFLHFQTVGEEEFGYSIAK